MKRTVVLLFLISPFVLAQGSSTGSSYLKFPVNARLAAMGESLVADSSVFASISLNPANLFTTGSSEILFSHSEWIQDTQSEALGASVPLSFGTFAFTLLNSNVRGIEVREIPGPPIATFDSRSAVFQLSYATQLIDELTIGAAVNYLYEKIYVDEATGYGIDVGALYRTPLEGLLVGISATHLGKMNAFRNQRGDLPATLRLGGTYRFKEFDLDWTVAGAAVNDLKRSENRLSFGVEGMYDHLVCLRFGYQTGIDSRGFSSGLGIHYSFVRIDYAYLPFSFGLGSAHVISIGLEL